MPKIASFKHLKNGTITITGLTPGDFRVIARGVEAGAFEGGDRGGPMSHALARFGDRLRSAAMFPGRTGDQQMVCSGSDPDSLYREVLADGTIDRT